MPEMQSLSAAIAEHLKLIEPGSRAHLVREEILAGDRQVAERRARVLSHPDLAAKLASELGYARPENWNGWVPPKLLDPAGDGESLLRADVNRYGAISYRYNQLGKRAIGQRENDSPRRAALVAIAAEALRREQEGE